VYLTVLVFQLISTSVFSAFGAIFPLVANCTRPCAGLYLYLRVTVPAHARHCASVHVLARVNDCTCSYARLYLLVCVTALVLARVFKMYSCVVHDCTCSYARLYMPVCATAPARVRECTCTR
jgi:hypothetical protein